MATTTTNLGLTKPALSESADVGVINDNSDKLDAEAGKSRANFAATYSASSAYAVGAYCERGGNLYRCTTAIPSGGEAWNSGHWTQVAVTGEIPKVIDNLTSTSTSAALSAKQGKVLADKVGAFEDYGSDAISSSTPFTFTAKIDERYMIVATSGAASHSGLWIAQGASSEVNVYTVYAGSALTASASGMVITISKSSSRNTNFTVMKIG